MIGPTELAESASLRCEVWDRDLYGCKDFMVGRCRLTLSKPS